MASPPPKRRRLDPTNVLSRPFKSPFRTPLKKPSAPSATNPTAATTADDPTSTHEPPAENAGPQANTPSRPRTARPPRTSPGTAPSPSPSRPGPDPELAALQREHNALLAQLGAARTALDTHSQALKIEGSGKDAELQRLVGVWTGAARDAAEQLFGGVRDRVNRMGGVAAWREMEREKMAGGRWGEGDERDARDARDDGDERDDGNERDEREEREEREERAETVEGGDDDGFTMDMMLQSLNIELDVIGFDKEMQRWIY